MKSVAINDVVLQKIITLALPIAAIQKIWLFGSRASGAHKPTSDYDLAFEWIENVQSHWGEVALKMRETNPSLNSLDLIRLDQISDDFKKRILNEGILIYEKLEQSLVNLENTIKSLELAVSTPPIEDRDYGGIIQAFCMTYELTWKTLKLILEQNNLAAPFPRIVFEEAFKAKMVEGNNIWKDIMEDRNLTTHIYDKSAAVILCDKIKNSYTENFRKTFEKIKSYRTE